MPEIIVLKAQPFDPDATVLLPAIVPGDMPAGMIDYPTPGTITLTGLETDVFMATADFNTGRSDTPADQHVPGCVLQAFGYTQRLWSGDYPLQRGQFSGGVIEVADPAGDLDYLADYGLDERKVYFYRGDRDAAFSTFDQVACMTMAGMDFSLKRKSIKLRDWGYQTQKPLQWRLYGGTGGSDGHAGLLGQPKPMTFGKVFNVAPLLIDITNLVFQWHDAAVMAVTALRVGGVAYAFSADYGDFASLVAAPLSGGQYATCNALGLVRIGNALPQGQGVTLDGSGEVVLGGLTRLFDAYRGVALRAGSEFSGLFGAPTSLADAGIHIPSTERPTSQDVLDGLAFGVGAYPESRFATSERGDLAASTLKDPADLVPSIDLYYSQDDVTEWECRAVMPAQEIRLGYGRNWSPQQPAALAGSVSAADRETYGQQWKYVSTDDSAVAAKHPSAERLLFMSALQNEADAQVRCDELAALFSVRRDIWKVRTNLDPFVAYGGLCVRVFDHPRYGFTNPKQFLCIGSTASDARNSVILELFG